MAGWHMETRTNRTFAHGEKEDEKGYDYTAYDGKNVRMAKD